MRARIVVLLSMVLTGISGCGQTWEKNTDKDRELARETLIAALDAWKSGQIQSLAKRNPPLRFGDDDQTAGLRLTDYMLENEDAPIDPFRDVEVELTLQDSRGKVQRKTVTYQVGLEPHLTVLRSDN